MCDIYTPGWERPPPLFRYPLGGGSVTDRNQLTMTTGPPAAAHRPAQAPRPRLIICIRIQLYAVAYPHDSLLHSTPCAHVPHMLAECYEYWGIDPGIHNLSNEYQHPSTQQNLFFVAFVHLLAFLPLASLPPNCIFIRLGPLGLVWPSRYQTPSP